MPHRLLTPGGRSIPCNVRQEKHIIKEGPKRKVTVPLLDQSGIVVLSEFIKESIDMKMDCPILVTGDRGMGKTTIAVETALTIDPNFPHDNLAFWVGDISRLFQSNMQGDGSRHIYPQIIVDEAGYALFGLDWLTKQQKMIASQLIVNRVLRQIIWFIVPGFKKLNPWVRDVPNIWVHVSAPQEYLRGYAQVRVAPAKKQSPYGNQKFWEPRFAFIFDEATGAWWDEYESRKLAFVQKAVLEKAESPLTKRQLRVQRQRDILIQEIYKYRKHTNDPISTTRLGTMLELDQSMIVKIINAESIP